MIIILIVLGLILRLININQSLWLDEAVQAITSQGSFLNIFQELHGDFHPPLYHMFMWGWVHLFGNSEIILRFPSVIFGTLTIYVVYKIADYGLRINELRIKGLRISEIAGLIMATAPFHIYYSQEARPYAMGALLTCCSMLFFMQKKWWKYLLFTILALYSSYFVFFILLAQFIYLLSQKEFKNIKFIILSLFCFLPGLPLLQTQLQTGKEAMNYIPEWGQLVNLGFYKALPLTFIKFSIGRITIFDKTLYLLTAVFLIVFNGFLIFKGFLKKENKLWTLWFFVPLLAAWFVSFFIPNFQPFRLLLILPAFYLLILSGVRQLPEKFIRIIILILLSVNIISVFWFNNHPYFYREDWRSLVSYLESKNQATVIIPSQTSDWPWRYYAQRKATLIGVSDGPRKVVPEDLNNLAIQPFDFAQGKQLSIYYIRYLQQVFDPNEEILNWLNKKGYNKVKETSFNQLLIYEYKLTD